MSVPYDYFPGAPRVTSEEEKHLGLLSILFYVYSALMTVSALVVLGLAIVWAAVLPSLDAHARNPPPEAFFAVFAVVFGVIAALLFGKAALMFAAGRAFAQRRNHTLALVASCFAALNVPLGTALGVFALITLTKPSVKQLFSQPAPLAR